MSTECLDIHCMLVNWLNTDFNVSYIFLYNDGQRKPDHKLWIRYGGFCAALISKRKPIECVLERPDRVFSSSI